LKIVITIQGGNDLTAKLDSRFGRCEAFMVVDSDKKEVIEVVPNQEKNAAHGAGVGAAAKVAELGADAVISGRFGPKAASGLKAEKITMYNAPDGKSVEDILDMLEKGEIEEQTMREYR